MFPVVKVMFRSPVATARECRERVAGVSLYRNIAWLSSTPAKTVFSGKLHAGDFTLASGGGSGDNENVLRF
jgi:hypothetical protein